MQGLHAWTIYKKKLTKLLQYYDFTYHLYKKEYNEIIQLKKQKKQNYSTSVNSITHNVNCLYFYINNQYPQKLKELVLISLISSTEKFLIDLIKECFYRDKNLFKKNDQIIEFHKPEFLSYNSLSEIEEKILKKDFRELTSGGIKISRKYFKNNFNIEFADLVNIDLFLEYFDTRHLFVHSEGYIDEMYVKKYKKGKVGQRIVLSHEFITNGFELFKNFGEAITKKMLLLFPDNKRSFIQIEGTYKVSENNIFLITFYIENLKKELPILLQKNITTSIKLEDLLIKYFIKENKITLILKIQSINEKEIFSFIKTYPNLHEVDILKLC